MRHRQHKHRARHFGLALLHYHKHRARREVLYGLALLSLLAELHGLQHPQLHNECQREDGAKAQHTYHNLHPHLNEGGGNTRPILGGYF